MFTTSNAIVLSLRKHSDKAMLLSVYTQTGGRRELMVYGLGGRKNPKALYHSLQKLEITYNEHPDRSIQTLHEAHPVCVCQELTTDIRRQTIALFVAEVLARTLTMPMADPTLYSWLDRMIDDLDQCNDPENIPLRFIEGFNRAMGYDVYSEVRPQLRSLAVVSAILETADL